MNNIIPLRLPSLPPLIIDAACFTTQPFGSEEKNYRALLALGADLLRREQPFMVLLDAQILSLHANSSWAIRIDHLCSQFPFWFNKTVGGSMLEESRQLARLAGARIVSARAGLYGVAPEVMALQIDRDVVVYPLWGFLAFHRKPVEDSSNKIVERLLAGKKYKRHIVQLSINAGLQSAA